MPFAHPELILLILTIPLSIAIYIYYLKLRNRDLKALGNAKLLQSLMVNTQIHIRTMKFVFLMVGLFFLIFALLRPKWGKEKISVQQHSSEIVFILDNSLSMLAEDVYDSSISFSNNGISRFEMAKNLLRDLLKTYNGNQMSFMLVAGKAQIECPMTFNTELIQNVYLNQVKIAPEISQGSYFANAFDNAQLLFSPNNGLVKLIIFITDGENHEEGLAQAVKDLQDKNIVVHTIGVGSKQGSVIPLNSIEYGSLPFKVDSNNRQVITHLDEDVLRNIAHDTGGTYYFAEVNKRIGLLDKKADGKGTKSTGDLMVKKEQFQPFLFLSLAFFGLGFLFPESKQNLKQLTSPKQMIVFALIFFISTGFSQDEGDSLYDKEKYHQAIEEYSKEIEEKPNAELYMKRGNSHYKNKNHDEAIMDYEKGLEITENTKEKSQFHYNLGNSYYRKKDFKQAKEQYKESLRLDPGNEDARHNLFLIKKIEQKQKKKPQFLKKDDNGDLQKKESNKNKTEGDNGQSEQNKKKSNSLNPDQKDPYKPDFKKKENIEDMEMKDNLNEINKRDRDLRSKLSPMKKGKDSRSNFFYRKDW